MLAKNNTIRNMYGTGRMNIVVSYLKGCIQFYLGYKFVSLASRQKTLKSVLFHICIIIFRLYSYTTTKNNLQPGNFCWREIQLILVNSLKLIKDST